MDLWALTLPLEPAPEECVYPRCGGAMLLRAIPDLTVLATACPRQCLNCEYVMQPENGNHECERWQL